MINKNHIVRFLQPGGIIATGSLYNILCAAERALVKHIQLSVRQQMYCVVSEKYLIPFITDLKAANVLFEVDKNEYQNIVSSYVTEDVFQNANWVSESVYKDILDLFDYTPKLKINIIDHNQTFVPYFSGHLNFISSEIGNYWFLYLRLPKTGNTHCWPVLIYSSDIPRISRALEEKMLAEKQEEANKFSFAAEDLYRTINNKEKFSMQAIQQPLQIPPFVLPYYEGFNRYGNKTWLGIYRRDERFSIAFLKDICNVCIRTKIGQLHYSPWKSIIIKGILQPDRSLWDYVLNKHRINVRHASNELNWQVGDLDKEALTLKYYLVKQFNADDLRTFGLCFAIKTQAGKENFGSVLIRRQAVENRNKRFISDRYKYDILYTGNFNPNAKDYILYRSDVRREELSVYLAALCKYYYDTLLDTNAVSNPLYRQSMELNAEKTIKKEMNHQCRLCLTIYDESYGDSINSIAPGVAFSELDASYQCPTCGADKESFAEIEKKSLSFAYGS